MLSVLFNILTIVLTASYNFFIGRQLKQLFIPEEDLSIDGNGFVMPEKKPVKPESGYSKQHEKLGGKSLKTKNIRSATPRGFARAVFEANALRQFGFQRFIYPIKKASKRITLEY